MISSKMQIIGRDRELGLFNDWLNEVDRGKGNTIILNGPAGMGKSVLAENVKKLVVEKGFNVLAGTADAHILQPFYIFSEVFRDIDQEPILRNSEYTGFTKIFAVNNAGLLVADAAPVEEEGLDSDIFAGMLSAVQNFVRDSFDSSGDQNAGLGRLEYGDLKIIIEHGQTVFLAAVISGVEHQNMKNTLKLAVKDIEENYSQILSEWNGNMTLVKPIADVLDSLVGTKFLVRRDLEGVKLDAERLRIADQVLDSLSKMADEKPLAIVLEDIHWADESSLFVLEYLNRNIGQRKIFVLATVRTGEIKHIDATLLKMKEENTCQELILEQLGHQEILSLVDKILGEHSLGQEFIGKLEKQCEGNPFFVQEILNHMVQEGSITKLDGVNTLVQENYSIPENVDEVIRHRLNLLEPDAMSIAEYVSCIGREFDLVIPRSTNIMLNSDEALHKLEDTGIISIDYEKGKFTHALFQEVIYNDISQRWQSAYHKNIGEIYEKFYDINHVIYELARHFSKSREHKKGFDYCIMAGESAEESFAMDMASEFYSRALEVLEKLNVADKDSKKIKINLQLGDTLLLSSSLEKSLAAFKAVLEISQDTDMRCIALRKMASVHEETGNYEEALKLTAQGKEMVNKENPDYWKLEIQDAITFSRTGKFQEGIDSCNNAIAALDKLNGMEKEIGIAYNTMGMCHWYLGDFSSAFNDYEKCLAISTMIHDFYGTASAHNNMGILFQVQGDLDKALEQQQKGLHIREKIKDHMGVAASVNNIGLIYYDLGRYDEALEMQLRGLKIRSRVGHVAGLSLSYTNLGEIYKMKGQFEKALEHHLRSLELKKQMGDKWGMANAYNNMGVVHLTLQEFKKASEYFDKSIEICTEIDAKEFLIHANLGKAESLLGLGNTDEVTSIATDMEKLSNELGIKRSLTDSWLINARASSSKGEWAQAMEYFQKAEEGFKELGSKIDVAHVKFYTGEMYLAKGEPDKARDLMKNAKKEYKELGLEFLVEKCSTFIQKL